MNTMVGEVVEPTSPNTYKHINPGLVVALTVPTDSTNTATAVHGMMIQRLIPR